MYFKHPSDKVYKPTLLLHHAAFHYVSCLWICTYLLCLQTPLGQLHLRGARVEEVDRSCDSESDSDDSAFPDYTVAVWPQNQPPTYIMVPTKHEKVRGNHLASCLLLLILSSEIPTYYNQCCVFVRRAGCTTLLWPLVVEVERLEPNVNSSSPN